MARHFNGSSDQITTDVGGCAFTGDLSIMAICQRTTANTTQAIMDAVTSGATGFWEFGVAPSGHATPNNLFLATQSGTILASPTIALVTADGWCLIGVTKASGTTTPVFHKYAYGTGTWTHNNGSGSLAGNTGTNITVDIGNSGGDGWNGDIAIVGVWNAVLSTAQIENLPFTLAPWFQVAPNALWPLDQDTTTQKVTDISGNAAQENALTGTSIATSSVTVFNYGVGVMQPTIFVPAAPATPQIPLLRELQAVNRAAVI